MSRKLGKIEDAEYDNWYDELKGAFRDMSNAQERAVKFSLFLVAMLGVASGYIMAGTGATTAQGYNIACDELYEDREIHYTGSIDHYEYLNGTPTDIFWSANSNSSNAEGGVFLLQTKDVEVVGEEPFTFSFTQEITLSCNNGEIHVDAFIKNAKQDNTTVYR